MQRISTTVIALVGEPARACGQALDRAANIRFDQQGPAGELELAIGDTLTRWRARTMELPDYYLLLDPASWDPTRRHWYLGLLHRAAPARVVPADTATDRLQSSIATLASGRGGPDLDRLLADIDRVVPRPALTRRLTKLARL